ncbi:hypothetical protein Jab_2c02510 [Janthinobacterium sp. HH01]|uniref:hypothetical protein n=1 Tax=Janthinobacterium sp. HH01 TaxID=1198452 RepID=UPI0002AE99B3|nr:hypothetical protein [Janthinobacterium sp. HH01]ELX08205.1 hypothetical protein Jab_2c02510 [Janthinobacterium sp. HH01]
MNIKLRPLSSVPAAVRVMLAAALALQLGWQAARPPPQARAEALPPAPPPAALQLAALGDPAALSRLLMLYVQGFDEQAGVRIAWRELDYGKLRLWLERALDLDPRSQYPLLAASEVYGAVGDPARVRLMLDMVYQRFGEDPNRRWPWLAHAAVVARHRLHDLPLARRYARAIRLQAHGPQVPAWARELELFVLEDMNQAEAARALIGALLASGQITDPNELRFLERRLQSLAAPP